MPQKDAKPPETPRHPSDPQTELVLFQTYIETITAMEGRRGQMSGIYASILAAIIAATGLTETDPRALAGAAFFIANVWLINLAFYKNLADAKWPTALALEARFPVTPFAQEYDLIRLRRAGRRLLWLGAIARERILPRLVQVLSGAYLIWEGIRLLPHTLLP